MFIAYLTIILPEFSIAFDGNCSYYTFDITIVSFLDFKGLVNN